MTAIAQRSGGSLHRIFGIVFGPPVIPASGQISAPLSILHVPLCRQNEVVVSALGVVTLFPLAAVGENDVVRCKGEKGVFLREITENHVWLFSGIL